jgi:hypothetical protein
MFIYSSTKKGRKVAKCWWCTWSMSEANKENQAWECLRRPRFAIGLLVLGAYTSLTAPSLFPSHSHAHYCCLTRSLFHIPKATGRTKPNSMPAVDQPSMTQRHYSKFRRPSIEMSELVCKTLDVGHIMTEQGLYRLSSLSMMPQTF